MPPSRKPSSSHSSRPSRPSRPSGSSHRSSSHHSTHHSSYHHSPPRHSGYSSGHSGGGFFSGMMLGGILSQREQEQNRSTTVINQQIINTPQPKMYECPYCLGRVTGTPSSDGLQALTCPNCGGVLSESNAIVQPQPVQQTYSQQQSYGASPDAGSFAYTNRSSHGSQLKSCFGILLVTGLMCGTALVLFNVRGGKQLETVHNDYNNGYYENYDNGYPDHEDSIYVNELGRTCYWDDEYQCYYDSDTNCYFFENYDMDPPVWQYWFEGVSSDYGSDYGWLEWDYNENCWYVQKGRNTWVKLPESKYTEWLWHFD